MKAVLTILCIFLGQHAAAATKTECLDGNFAACKEIINGYGSTTDKRGATEFFTATCASQNLKITCQIITTEKSETMKKTLEAAKMDGALFVMSGAKADKIYTVSSVK